jgi:hypothetical protein
MRLLEFTNLSANLNATTSLSLVLRLTHRPHPLVETTGSSHKVVLQTNVLDAESEGLGHKCQLLTESSTLTLCSQFVVVLQGLAFKQGTTNSFAITGLTSTVEFTEMLSLTGIVGIFLSWKTS